jgi:hypothetical protein
MTDMYYKSHVIARHSGDVEGKSSFLAGADVLAHIRATLASTHGHVRNGRCEYDHTFAKPIGTDRDVTCYTLRVIVSANVIISVFAMSNVCDVCKKQLDTPTSVVSHFRQRHPHKTLAFKYAAVASCDECMS